jgi:septal ring factor EnvC (AmiA/AmiB activator)
MKKSILALPAAILTIAFAIISCSSPEEKVEKAQNEVVDANNKLDSAIKNYQEDIAAYRIETANLIVANEKAMADFNVKIAKQKKEKREEYLEDIAELEKKNTGMKNKLNGYKDNGSEKWKIFKMEFSKEMDDLGKSIKDLTTKDKD